MALFEYPKSAAFGRVLPKSKIYEHSKPSAKIKELFVSQVERIVWAYKLAPETTNLPSTPLAPEIQIFRVDLKTGELHEDVLRCIDKAIPFPLVFELQYNHQYKVTAAFKRPSEADTAKWVISDYFETDWLDANTQRKPLPVALDLSGLYEKLLEPIMPHKSRDNEDLQTHVSRMDQVHAKERELEKIQARLRKEKQFNKKVAINAELRKLKQEIQQLTQPHAVDEQ